jgi:hypothetical protein
MDKTVWEILGVEATTDERAIKRAYATKLKLTPPEVDPAGYMKLREAYENAKNYAQFQQRRAELESAAAEQPEEPAAATIPESPVDAGNEASSLSAQQQAFADLHSLLARRELDAFLQKVASIQSAQIFATLDEQSDFIGEVACLVLDSDIEESQWRGRLASLLGARDHENIFPIGTRYWYAYKQLLVNHAELRATAAKAHVEDQSHIAVTPGYLHVYHVLTGPFDAERLSALTRSQTYHRLAQQILERAKLDPTIVIPPENREWWDRTAMARQHRPIAEPVTNTRAAAATQDDSSWGIAYWVFWLFLIVVGLGFRGLPGDSSREFRIDQEQIKQLEQYDPGPPLVDHSLRLQEANAALDPRLALCDKQTRRAILLHLSVSQPNASFTEEVDPNPLRSDTPPRGGLRLDTSDPIVASLLAKCDASKYFDAAGMLRKLPE